MTLLLSNVLVSRAPGVGGTSPSSSSPITNNGVVYVNHPRRPFSIHGVGIAGGENGRQASTTTSIGGGGRRNLLPVLLASQYSSSSSPSCNSSSVNNNNWIEVWREIVFGSVP